MPISNSTGTATRAQAQHLEVRSKSYEAAALAQNEIVEMIDVLPGEVVYDVIVDFDALGSTTSISVGDGGSAARFIGTTVTTSAGVGRLNTVEVGRGYKYTTADTIDLKVVNTGAITGTVVVTVLLMRTFNV